jgi:predicted acetyltransferase
MIELVPARIEDKPLLRSLLADYLRELARFGAVNADYPFFNSYWDPQEKRWPYLLRREGSVAGFALINQHAPSGKACDFAIAEFCITPAARLLGVGSEAASALFRRHAGIWELGIMVRNQPAQRFWPKAIATSGARDVERIERADETIYRFRTD